MSAPGKIQVFAPSTVANVGPGYDILGFALEGIGDYLELEERADDDLVIEGIEGGKGIPTDPNKNVATVAIRSLLEEANISKGFTLRIRKNIKPGSGLGSSASSSAAAVFAVNELIQAGFDSKSLIRFAMKGEELASGKPHADNVAPSIMGGFTVIRSYDPLDVFNIPYPKDLGVLIIFPDLEVKTSVAKSVLKHQITMKQAIQQWGNVAGLISGLIQEDYDLISRSMQDVVVEPVRSLLLPYYQEVKSICRDLGVTGFNISGSGPSMFALAKDQNVLEKVKSELNSFYEQNNLTVTMYSSAISSLGARVL